jgi:predicted RNA-binding Zn-ribbon protein involved in translation (DUF1610 family)
MSNDKIRITQALADKITSFSTKTLPDHYEIINPAEVPPPFYVAFKCPECGNDDNTKFCKSANGRRVICLNNCYYSFSPDGKVYIPRAEVQPKKISNRAWVNKAKEYDRLRLENSELQRQVTSLKKLLNIAGYAQSL